MNTENKLDLDRESWLFEASQLILADRILPHMTTDITWPFRISIGYPPRSRANSKVIAVCIVHEASNDGHSEIFVTPAISDSILILTAVVHELSHYSDNCQSGHRGHFARISRAAGLIGKITECNASDELKAYLQTIVDILGSIPHAAIDLNIAVRKQNTRMLKLECADQKECKFSYRTVQTNIAKIQEYLCPACNIHDMKVIQPK